jgi:hypothetical protein
VKSVPGGEAPSVEELDAGALPPVVGPLLDEGGARDQVRVDRGQLADVGAGKNPDFSIQVFCARVIPTSAS